MEGRPYETFGKEREDVRLELSSEGRYGLRALIYLARIDGPATRDKISVESNIPRRLLARVLARLSGAGLVESQEGRGGARAWPARQRR
jgi:DNA-binding IscR family transcriptional regulator